MPEIARSLRLLRKERKISQKAAAEGLGVSQALLSHYENGAREPGLDFAVRACEYYGVSADFILGRTMERTSEPPPDFDASEDKGNRLKGSAAALMGKRMVVNSQSLIFDAAGKTADAKVVAAVLRFSCAAVYKLFRLLYSANADNPPEFFPVEERVSQPYADAELKTAEAELLNALAGAKNKPELSHDALTEEYPLLTPSLLNVLHRAGENKKFKS